MRFSTILVILAIQTALAVDHKLPRWRWFLPRPPPEECYDILIMAKQDNRFETAASKKKCLLEYTGNQTIAVGREQRILSGLEQAAIGVVNHGMPECPWMRIRAAKSWPVMFSSEMKKEMCVEFQKQMVLDYLANTSKTLERLESLPTKF